MSGYIEAGYVIVFGSLGTYALSLVTRERAARRRQAPPPPDATSGVPSGQASSGGERS
ncbi:MAG: hypothetical protein ACLQNG_13345 [Acidimicrobiales bacterium]|jgi:hypothetical protein